MAQSEEKPKAALVCTLTTPELQERRAGVLKGLRESAKEFRELDNGLSLRYSKEKIGDLVEFIKLERDCCNFLEFTLRFEANDGPVWLSVTGHEGAKAIITAEFGPLRKPAAANNK